MSALRLINETTVANGTSSAIVNDLFSSDFDIYQIQINRTLATATGGITLKLVNSSGGIIPALFDYAYLNLAPHTTFAEGRLQNSSALLYLDWSAGTTEKQSSMNYYIFNPYSNSSYTFFLGQSAGLYDPAGASVNIFKQIAVAKNTSSATGVQLYPSQGGTFGLEIKTYGLRVDNG